MPAPEFDWTFADAPHPGEPPSKDPASSHKRPARSWPRLSPLQRRLIVALAGVTLLAAAGAWLFTRLGLRRLQTGLAAQIVYEDQRAEAGDAAAVLALQAPGEADWRDAQAARVRLGLAAPLPAGDLRPINNPPRLASLDPLGGDLFAATVSRDYTDLAGHTVTFDLLERYRNVSPGAWERLPPDASALTATTPFMGQRLMAAVPTADLPWLGPALLQADDLIVKTCADWGDACPPDRRLAVSFGATPELSRPALTAGERLSNGPLILYLSPALMPGNQAAYLLAAPLLAGRPQGDAAQAALSRSLSVQLLGSFAGEVSGGARTQDDYFLDALVARAEVRRLGASAAPQPAAPQNYMALAALWAISGQQPGPASSWRTDLPLRRQAFDFFNSALAGEPASVDGALLRTLRRGGKGMDMDNWLAGAVGRGAATLAAGWDQKALAEVAARPVADWTPYDGLVLACQDGVYRVQGGAAPEFAGGMPAPLSGPTIGDLSPDGRYLALTLQSFVSENTNAPSPWNKLLVMDLTNGSPASVVAAPQVTIYGWSAADALIYTLNTTRLDATLPATALTLWTYDAATARSRVLITDQVTPYSAWPGQWSADHTRLLLTLAGPSSGGWPQPLLAVLTLGPPVSLRRLAQAGDVATLSPDSQRVAYLKLADHATSAAGASWAINWLNVLDVATGSVTTLAASNDPNLPPGITGFGEPIWSADGAEVAWLALHENQGDAGGSDEVLTAQPNGSPVRVWAGAGLSPVFPTSFSPDGHYLASGTRTDWPAHDQYWVFDRQAATVLPPLTGWAQSAVWAPTGHRLILANTAGVSALDPASGEWEYLGPWQGCQLRW